MTPKLCASAVAALPLSMFLFAHAQAACTGPSLNQTQLTTALSGNTVCAARSGERWQEYHEPRGGLVDYKRGPSHPVDPSDNVGNWSIVGAGSNATVVYNYGPGGTFSYSVRSNGGSSYSLCGASNFEVTVIPGQVACP